MQCAKRLRKSAPNLRVILVPRHFERATDLQKELAQAGFVSALKTDLTNHHHEVKSDALIVNTTGELRDWQHLPTVVVIGKSFLEKGGQNPAEAIAAGTPVITGPHMENFASLMRHLWSEDGIVSVPTVESLDSAIGDIMQQPESARKRVAHGQTVLRQHLGAALRTSQHVIEFPGVPDSPIS
jgi:3-deoxy-D-manno-octulosonic-acid transferase